MRADSSTSLAVQCWRVPCTTPDLPSGCLFIAPVQGLHVLRSLMAAAVLALAECQRIPRNGAGASPKHHVPVLDQKAARLDSCWGAADNARGEGTRQAQPAQVPSD